MRIFVVIQASTETALGPARYFTKGVSTQLLGF